MGRSIRLYYLRKPEKMEMKLKKTCAFCGKDFITKHPYARFCNTNHRVLWHKKQKQLAEQERIHNLMKEATNVGK